jgi:hypothetical protein
MIHRHTHMFAQSAKVSPAFKKVSPAFKMSLAVRWSKSVLRTTEVASGDKVSYLPDIVVCWNEASLPVRPITSPMYGEIESEPDSWRLGHHRDHGFLVLVRGRQINHAPSVSVTELPSMVQQWLSIGHN